MRPHSAPDSAPNGDVRPGSDPAGRAARVSQLWRRLPAATGGDGLRTVSTFRFAAILSAIAGAVTLYIGHVYATQDLLNSLEPLRRDNLELHLELDRLRGKLEEVTGPAVIYHRATQLGLQEGGPYNATIRVGAIP